MSSPKARWIAEAIIALLCLPLLSVAFKNIGALFAAARFRWLLDREEGFVAVQGHWLATGRGIYLPIQEEPFVVGTYAPVYPLLIAIGDLLGADPLAAGRFIAALSAVGIALLLSFFAYHFTRLYSAGLLAFVLFCSTYEFLSWGRFARVDFTSILFGLAGFTAIFLLETRWRFIIAAILFSIGFYTKQVQVFTGIAVGLWVTGIWLYDLKANGFKKDSEAWRDFCYYAIASVLAVFLPFHFLQLATNGEYYLNAVVANANVFDWWQLRVWRDHLIRFDLFRLVIAGIAIAVIVYTAWRDKESWLILLYSALVAASFLMIAKRGSAENYLIEIHTVLILLPLFAAGLLLRRDTLKSNILGYTLLCFLLLGQTAHYFNWHGMAKPRLADIQQFHRALPTAPVEDAVMLEVLSVEGDVLTEEPMFAFRAEKEVLYHPFIMTQLAAEGKWDPAPFISDIRNQRFAMIITLEELEVGSPVVGWSDEARAAILDSYRRTAVYQHPELRKNYFIFRPEPDAP